MSTAVLVALLVAAGVYLLLQRGLVRVIFGFVLLGHAANVLLLGAGGMDRRDPPLLADGSTAQAADPLPQAFALTAIVIAFGITVYLLALAGNGGERDAPPSDAEPSASGGAPRTGTPGGRPDGTSDGDPVDGPSPGAVSGPMTAPAADPEGDPSADAVGTTPTGAAPTGPTTGREHA